MEMRVGDRLSGCFTDIDADVVAVRLAVCLDVPPHRCHQCPSRGLFLRRQRKEIGLVPTWDNQAMARIHWECIEERDRQIIAGYELSTSEAVAEDASHSIGPYHAPAAPVEGWVRWSVELASVFVNGVGRRWLVVRVHRGCRRTLTDDQ
jgi:hypothetical protein